MPLLVNFFVLMGSDLVSKMFPIHALIIEFSHCLLWFSLEALRGARFRY